jgi:hypothetical protein
LFIADDGWIAGSSIEKIVHKKSFPTANATAPTVPITSGQATDAGDGQIHQPLKSFCNMEGPYASGLGGCSQR